MCVVSSLVESEHPVGEAGPKADHSVDAPEATVLVVDPSEELLMSTVAERCVGAHLAVAELEVARLGHVEGHWTATGQDPLALAIAERGVLGVATSAPVIDLTAVKVGVSGEDTSKCWQGWRPVFAFFVWARFTKLNCVLFGEISDIVH